MATKQTIHITKMLSTADALLKDETATSNQLRAIIVLLVAIVNLLLNKLNLNSSNSSKPPSTDPLGKNKKGCKKKDPEAKRKPGGQDGHKGTTLLQEEKPDIIELIDVDKQAIPSDGNYQDDGFEARQVVDLELTKVVTEYRAQILKDENGNKIVAKFPDGVTQPIQYGNSVKTMAVYMSQEQLVPYDRIREFFFQQCGVVISAGSLFNFNREAFKRLEQFESMAKQQLPVQDVLHADETGININGKLNWLHTLSSPNWTLFFAHSKRGFEAIKAMDTIKSFTGTLCHDHWKPYFSLQCKHSLCNAHHLRELEFAAEQDGQIWASDMQKLLLEINQATINVGGSLDEKSAKFYLHRYREILHQGDKECPGPVPGEGNQKRGRIGKSKSRNLLERLQNFETETLRFMTDPLVPFTNNIAENDIRMTKVQQKISGCFRSFEGAAIFCRVKSYLLTCKKHGMGAKEALDILFSGKFPDFIRPPDEAQSI